MNKTPTQIAAEAAKALKTKVWPNGQEFIDREHAQSIIKSAIEKATEPLSKGWLEQAAKDAAEIVRLETLIEATLRHWQDTIRDELIRLSGSDKIDGTGCESGDPLDFTIAEIRQAFQSRAAHASEQELHVLSNGEKSTNICYIAKPDGSGFRDVSALVEYINSQRPTHATVIDATTWSATDTTEQERELEITSSVPERKPDSDSVGKDDDELLPCPFCGSDRVRVSPLTDGFVVDCFDCGGGCGTCHDEQAARDEWNKRKSLREVLKERGIDSDKVTEQIESRLAATPSGGGEKWTMEQVMALLGSIGSYYDRVKVASVIQAAHNATLQPRDAFKCRTCGAALGWCEPDICDKCRDCGDDMKESA